MRRILSSCPRLERSFASSHQGTSSSVGLSPPPWESPRQTCRDKERSRSEKGKPRLLRDRHNNRCPPDGGESAVEAAELDQGIGVEPTSLQHHFEGCRQDTWVALI